MPHRFDLGSFYDNQIKKTMTIILGLNQETFEFFSLSQIISLAASLRKQLFLCVRRETNNDPLCFCHLQ